MKKFLVIIFYSKQKKSHRLICAPLLLVSATKKSVRLKNKKSVQICPICVICVLTKILLLQQSQIENAWGHFATVGLQTEFYGILGLAVFVD